MAYTGAATVLTGATSASDLSRDVYIETLEAFNRTVVGLNLVRKQTIQSGKAGQFIIGGKTSEDYIGTAYPQATGSDTYARGSQVDVAEAEMDERTILIARPTYVAKRIDQFEERVAHYDVRSIITNQMGEILANKVDRQVFDTITAAALKIDITGNTVSTALVHNPDAPVIAAITYTGTAKAKGDLLAEAIFEAAAGLISNDVMETPVCVLNPIDYANLVQSDRAVNADYTNGNGGIDSGTVMEVAGVRIMRSNNLKGNNGGVAGTSEKLLGLVFTSEAAGVLELIGMTTNQEKQIDFLDATLMTAYYANGMGVLRPECAVAIVSA